MLIHIYLYRVLFLCSVHADDSIVSIYNKVSMQSSVINMKRNYLRKISSEKKKTIGNYTIYKQIKMKKSMKYFQIVLLC